MDLPTYRNLANQDQDWYCNFCTLPTFSDSFFDNSKNSSFNFTLNESASSDPTMNSACPKRVGIVHGCDKFNSTKGLKICHINSGQGGLLCHLDDIICTINKLKPDILAISETWLNEDTPTEAVTIPGYCFCRRDKPNNFIGAQGVGLYIKDNISYEEMPELDHPHLMNHSIKVHRRNRKPLLISVLYRHPRMNISFYEHMEDFLVQLDNSIFDIVITGDFNIDFTHVDDPSSAARTLNDITSTYGLSQVINAPTRITDSSATIIDLTLTNIKNYSSGVGVVSVADHLMNFIILDSKFNRPNHRFITSRNFKKLDPLKFVTDLTLVPWHII